MALNNQQKSPDDTKRGSPRRGREDITFRAQAVNDDFYSSRGEAAENAMSNENTYFPTIDSEYRKESSETSQNKANGLQNEGQVSRASSYTSRINPTIASKIATLRGSDQAKTSLNERILATRVIGPLAVGQIPWMITQFTWGVIGAVFFMAALGLDSLSDTTDKGLLGATVARVVSGALWVARSIGVDIIGIALAGYFVCYLLIISITIISITMIFTTMLMNQMRPLSGQAMSLKYGTLLLVFIAYSTPIVNMLPWLLAYLFVVWLYPK
jgi:hypothetical protein